MITKDPYFKYEYSNGQITHTYANGKKETFAICDACGKEHKNNFGLEISFSMRNHWGWRRIKLCGKCANRVIPILIRASDAIADEVDARRTNVNRWI